MNTATIYEDEYFLAVNKAAGRVCDPKDFRYFLIHRLDKDTSGVLLLAKTGEALEKFQKLFRERRVRKVYLGLFHGLILKNSPFLRSDVETARLIKLGAHKGMIDAPIKRLKENREKFALLKEGKPSQTAFKVLKYFRHQSRDYSLAEISPITGRTHQIRVHFACLGWPLVGDKIYEPKIFKAKPLAIRQFLHAKSISFRHPFREIILRVESALPDDLKSVIKLLRRFELKE